MKKNLLLLPVICLFVYSNAIAQWCVPTTAIPYLASMPGITKVVFNTIDRSSDDCENYPNNNYVNTGLSTDLYPGQTYSISITFTVDAPICPDMNIRVWIDYNQDYQLDDVGELVVSADNQFPGTFTSSFTVPSNVTLGTTRMRVTTKMTANGGHTLPSPCDIPADPFGYHGEIEDYDIVFLSTTGIGSVLQDNSFTSFFANGNLHFKFTTEESSFTGINLFDLQGKLISEVLPAQIIQPNSYEFELNSDEVKIESGMYLAVLISNSKKYVTRIVIP